MSAAELQPIFNALSDLQIYNYALGKDSED